MKLTASAKSGIQGMGFLLIAVGVILLFGEIRYVGEAIESVKVNLLFNPATLLGCALVLLPTVVILVLFIRRNRS